MPWLRMLNGATTPDEVVDIAQAFVSQLTPTDVEFLPKECRPPQLTTPEDVRRYALQLVQHHGHGDNSRFTLRISEVLSAAAIRIVEMQRQGEQNS